MINTTKFKKKFIAVISTVGLSAVSVAVAACGTSAEHSVQKPSVIDPSKEEPSVSVASDQIYKLKKRLSDLTSDGLVNGVLPTKKYLESLCENRINVNNLTSQSLSLLFGRDSNSDFFGSLTENVSLKLEIKELPVQQSVPLFEFNVHMAVREITDIFSYVVDVDKPAVAEKLARQKYVMDLLSTIADILQSNSGQIAGSDWQKFFHKISVRSEMILEDSDISQSLAILNSSLEEVFKDQESDEIYGPSNFRLSIVPGISGSLEAYRHGKIKFSFKLAMISEIFIEEDALIEVEILETKASLAKEFFQTRMSSETIIIVPEQNWNAYYNLYKDDTPTNNLSIDKLALLLNVSHSSSGPLNFLLPDNSNDTDLAIHARMSTSTPLPIKWTATPPRVWNNNPNLPQHDFSFTVYLSFSKPGIKKPLPTVNGRIKIKWVP